MVSVELAPMLANIICYDDDFNAVVVTEENRNATRIFNDKVALLQAALDEAEHTLNTKLNSPIPRDVDSLEHLVIQHRDFETRLKVSWI